MNNYKRASELLYRGDRIDGMSLKPETVPVFLTSAFTMDDLDELHEIASQKGYTYIRNRNPNREALAQAVSYLENGEKSLIFNSGMAAITTSIQAFLQSGDHVVANFTLYGETLDVFTALMPKFGLEVSIVDFTDLEAVRAAIRPNTKMLYTEVLSNPCVAVADIEALGKMAHENGAMLMVDNTFTTPLAIRPLDLGADVVINSLTKFMNGHSDCMGGSVTTTAERIDVLHKARMLCGTAGDPFSSWLIQRGLHTVELRVPRQMANAQRVAEALEADPHVKRVCYPGLPSHPQHALAKRMFTDMGMGAMLSFEVPDDPARIKAFMHALHFPHYAPTLGGIRSSLSHPVNSSHFSVPVEERLRMGITDGTFRLSTGIEDADDLVADFTQALKVFD